jgi:hypothetical protein
MSDSDPTPGGTPATPPPASGAAAAQEAFGKYKARLAGGPMAMPAMPGWAMPPSMGALPNYPPGYPFAQQGPERPHPMGSLTERVGATLRLAVDLLNATLASGASALSGGMAAYYPGGQWGGQWGGQGCGCERCGGDRCGYDCCAVTGSECCRPGAHGCGCGCG